MFDFCISQHTAVRANDFSDVTNLTSNDSAVKSGQVLRLTQGSHHVSGSAWFNTEQPVPAGFTSIFKFQISHSASRGADLPTASLS